MKSILLLVILLLPNIADATKSPFKGGALTLGIAVPSQADPGGIVSYEIGTKSLLTSFNPYGSFTYVRDNQLTSFGRVEIIGTSVALGVSIPTGTLIKPRIGFNYNVMAIPGTSDNSFGLDVGMLITPGNGLALTSSYNSEFEIYSIGVGFAW